MRRSRYIANEGINELDGTDHLYSRPGEAGNQPYWDSKLFDYGKGEVQHFLLSNRRMSSLSSSGVPKRDEGAKKLETW